MKKISMILKKERLFTGLIILIPVLMVLFFVPSSNAANTSVSVLATYSKNVSFSEAVGNSINTAVANGNLILVEDQVGARGMGHYINVLDSSGTHEYYDDLKGDGNWHRSDIPDTPAAPPEVNNAINNAVNAAKNDKKDTPLLLDSNGKEIARGNSKEMQDALKKLAEQPTNKKPEPNLNKCLLIIPGMSKKLGKMYGEKGIKAKNDRYMSRPTVEGTCVLGKPHKEDSKGVEFSTVDEYGGKDPCIWAVDYDGNDVMSDNDVEDPQNFEVRKKEAAGPEDEQFSVTDDEDLKAMNTTKAGSVEIRKNNKNGHKGQSNLQIAILDTSTDGSPNQGTIIDKHIPNTEQHKHFWINPGNRTYIVPEPAGSTINKEMNSGIYPAGGKASSAEGKKTNKEDVKVTAECKYNVNDDKAPQAPDPNGNKWPGGGNGSNGGGGSGGGGDQGKGGLLGKLLPALMQALQGLGKGGGQQQQPQDSSNPSSSGSSNDTASPSPSPYACPIDSEAEAVCGTDGATYSSRCVAEYENQVSVKHTGACSTGDDTTETPDLLTSLETILSQVSSSGIPNSLINTVTSTISDLIIQILNGTSSTSDTTATQ
jgi:hypothetical protein